MSLILTYEGELYKEPDNSYGEKTKIVKVIPKYDYKNFSHKNVTYRDKDENKFEIGDIVKLDTGEKLIFICETKRFAHLCSFDAIDEFNGTVRVPLDIIEKNGEILSDFYAKKLICNIKEAQANKKHIAREIKAKIKTLVM